MSENTKIEWADHSWSPWRGCTKVSPGCANCYAETLSKRNPAVLGQWGKGAPRVLAKNWGDPVRWNRSSEIRSEDEDGARGMDPFANPRVFPSLCDWLDEEVSPAWLAEFLAIINLTPNLDWLLLTKRPQHWRERINAAALASTPFHQRWLVEWLRGTPPPNVWLGVSVEDQIRANERIPILMDIPAKLRWLSVEPLLGPVKLRGIEDIDGNSLDSLTGNWRIEGRGNTGPKPERINWVVIGGESGSGARPCHVDWIRDIVRECQTAELPVFVKQLGSRPVADDRVSEIRHPKGGDPDEWPQDIRVRQFPTP